MSWPEWLAVLCDRIGLKPAQNDVVTVLGGLSVEFAVCDSELRWLAQGLARAGLRT